jgi:hypothetical protein
MITIRTVYFVIALVVFLVALIGAAMYYLIRNRQRKMYPYGKWEALMRRFVAVDRENIVLVARDLVDDNGERRFEEGELDLDPSQIWPLVGGMKGLEILESNCRVLVDLVFYAQQWYPEVLSVTEQLRQQAREIELHIQRIKDAEKHGQLESWYPNYAPRVVATYYVMTRRVLSLYEQMNLPGLAELQRTL